MSTRTSFSQFELMVDYMERNGDLNKPAGGPHGRLSAITKWEELTMALNLNITGQSKPVDKWKKNDSALASETIRLEVPPPFLRPRSPTPTRSTIQVDNMLDELMRPGGSGQSTPFPTEIVEVTTASPTTSHVQQTGSPARPRARRIIPGHRATPDRRRRPRVRPRSAHADAAQNFIHSDNLWRDLATKFVTESLRQREAELQMQAQWQTLFAKYLELLDKKINK
ncbi:unnamed protein product [Spodoptera littoralis]|uniref:Regulatory protein zeste n=1 Tax=Spodoptera littoralis TaxID=7109 RepID=A0A9P0N6S3_SPOLI|nr:unnamed protein product [Spodoptera littoralis]CAH1643579.1 unnamed protein product [Spodoptera littoralis]